MFAVTLYRDYLLTYSMVQSSSWEANWFAASQEIPRISRNPKVHYHTHKRPPPVSILGQPNPVHIPTSHLLEIRPNIIHPSKPRSPQWSLSLRFPHQLDTLISQTYSWNKTLHVSGSSSVLLPNCQQTCMIYSITVCTVKTSWWWTEELSETCIVSFQK